MDLNLDLAKICLYTNEKHSNFALHYWTGHAVEYDIYIFGLYMHNLSSQINYYLNPLLLFIFSLSLSHSLFYSLSVFFSFSGHFIIICKNIHPVLRVQVKWIDTNEHSDSSNAFWAMTINIWVMNISRGQEKCVHGSTIVRLYNPCDLVWKKRHATFGIFSQVFLN